MNIEKHVNIVKSHKFLPYGTVFNLPLHCPEMYRGRK